MGRIKRTGYISGLVALCLVNAWLLSHLAYRADCNLSEFAEFIDTNLEGPLCPNPSVFSDLRAMSRLRRHLPPPASPVVRAEDLTAWPSGRRDDNRLSVWLERWMGTMNGVPSLDPVLLRSLTELLLGYLSGPGPDGAFLASLVSLSEFCRTGGPHEALCGWMTEPGSEAKLAMNLDEEYTGWSLAALIGGEVLRIYRQQSLADREQFWRRLMLVLHRKEWRPSPLPVLLGGGDVFRWWDEYDRYRTRLLSVLFPSLRPPLHQPPASEVGRAAPPLKVVFDWRGASPEVGRDLDLAWRTQPEPLSKAATGQTGVLKQGRLHLPGRAFPHRWSKAFRVERLVLVSCDPPPVTSLESFATQVERITFIEVCTAPRTIDLADLWLLGPERFLLKNRDLGFIEYYLPALSRYVQQSPIRPLPGGDWFNDLLTAFRWNEVRWHRAFSHYETRAPLDVVRFFRPPSS